MAHNIDSIVSAFAREVPEIASGIIEIKAIARKPGYRCKLALHSQDPHVDCVGACVGVRGNRIKNIIDTLNGERIDLVRWIESPKQFIANALQPSNIEEVILYPDQRRAVVVVVADHVSLVRGRGDQNRELASRLTGWEIEVAEK